MRVLLTNDDGYSAVGLAALRAAVAAALPDAAVDIIAPARALSGSSHAVSPEMCCRRIESEELGPAIVVQGTPADCMRAAVALPGHPRPDWVLAGINRGGNIGVDVYYSGTVAAAREAAILGLRAIAISQLVRTEWPDDWTRSVREAAAVIGAVVRPGGPVPAGVDAGLYWRVAGALTLSQQGTSRTADGPGPTCWNVNLPALPAGQSAGDARVVPISHDPLHIAYASRRDDDGSETLTYTGNYYQRPAAAGTDVAAVFGGAIAISPLLF